MGVVGLALEDQHRLLLVFLRPAITWWYGVGKSHKTCWWYGVGGSHQTRSNGGTVLEDRTQNVLKVVLQKSTPP